MPTEQFDERIQQTAPASGENQGTTKETSPQGVDDRQDGNAECQVRDVECQDHDAKRTPAQPNDTQAHATRRTPLMTEDEIATRLVPVIVGGTFLSYSYVREFHRAYGVTRCIVVLTQEIKMLTTSRFTDCRIVPDAGDPQGLCRALESIAAELHAENPQLVPLVLGCDDRHALIFGQYQDRLREAGYVVACNDYDMLESVSLKHCFYELCEKLDVPYPKTRYFDCSANGPETLPVQEFSYPLFAKPSDTTLFQNAEVAHKRKAYEIESPEEMASVWSDVRASSYDGELVIQDYIPGGDENLRILNTFSDETGTIRAVSGGIVCLQDHNPAALGNPLCIIGEKDAKTIACAERILKHLRFSGFANFDLKYDPRTGESMFFEINIRAGRSTYYMSLGGVNFITLLVDAYVLGRDVPYQEAYEPFSYCCVPPLVLKKSIADADCLKRTLALRKQTKDPYPLGYAPDTLAHNFWSYVMYFNQIRKFKRFFWDTDGKQFKE